MKTLRFAEVLLLVLAAVFWALHGLHLSADFPNHSPWMDWAKYTDEGWYGDAAIRHFQRGHWYVPGDFNPAAALPVWPFLEAVVFRFTGVSLVAARSLAVAIFGLTLLAVYLFVRRSQMLYDREHGYIHRRPAAILAPAIAVVLLAVSPFCYVFTRMAVLEPLLILLTLLALLTATYATNDRGGARVLPLLVLGLLLPTMVLTKTTALFLFPSICWILWARSGYSFGRFVRLATPIAGVGIALWLSFFLFVVRPHFLADYRYLFSANAYTGITPSTAFTVLFSTVSDGFWIGTGIYWLALAAFFAILFRPRILRNPAITALVLWAAGYAAFLAYHDNLQPRYYLVIAVPLTMLVPLVFANLWPGRVRSAFVPPIRYLAAGTAFATLIVLVVADARQTVGYVRAPEYTFTTAASEIDRIISSDTTHNPLILSISGSNLSLMTGLPSICDDFGTMELADRVRAYHPGWYVAWNQVDDDKMDALSPLYRLRRVAAFPAMDDPERNLLILYRLDPASPGSHPRHRRASVPHLLQTDFGQQPAVIQLEH